MEIILIFGFKGLAIMVLKLSMRARAVYKNLKMGKNASVLLKKSKCKVRLG